MRYPWLEWALANEYSRVLAYNEIRSVHGAPESNVANQVVAAFLEELQQAEKPAA
jgi:hypothetical protein